MPDLAPPRSGRGRRPAAQVRAAVLDAAAHLLVTEGLAAVTFDRVASVAGSSKMTLYKWWPSPGALAAEAYFTRSQDALSFPDTGDLVADLTTQLRSFIRLLTGGGAGRPVAELIGAAQSDPALAQSWSRYYSMPRRQLARDRLAAARRQGQLRPEADGDLVVDQLWGACYHRLLVPDVPLDESLAEMLVRQALFGAAEPAAPAPWRGQPAADAGAAVQLASTGSTAAVVDPGSTV